MDRQTKIIATLGPACASPETISELVAAGMNVARLNFSHGDHDDHRRFAGWVRDAATEQERSVALLQDIQGPKIRIGELSEERTLSDGERVSLVSAGGAKEAADAIPVAYPHLLEDLAEGHQVLIDDGLIRLEVDAVRGDRLTARVVTGGTLRSQSGVALPDSELHTSSVTRKDIADLEVGQELGVDLVAASFVRSAADVRMVAELAGGRTPVIAKIELAGAYERLDEILATAQGVMVARGDLGVQLPLAKIPIVQRDILARTNARGLVSITATEMLESMTSSPRPTRAEVTDVSTAVLSGTDAVMLSGETAVGRYPVKVVEMMDAICRESEAGMAADGSPPVPFLATRQPIPAAIARAAAEAARDIDITTIVAFTESGDTARLISKHRPRARIVAFTPDPVNYRRLAINWGVVPVISPRLASTDEMIVHAERWLLDSGWCSEDEQVVMVAGTPPGRGATTNLLKFHRIGEGELYR